MGESSGTSISTLLEPITAFNGPRHVAVSWRTLSAEVRPPRAKCQRPPQRFAAALQGCKRQDGAVIVVDGRTDDEKLSELLDVGVEQTALDFKATLNLSNAKDKLCFVKDCVAMMHLNAGGYIVAGVDNEGKPAHCQPPLDLTQFDASQLRAHVAAYVDAPVHIVSQKHVIDRRDVVLIYIQANPDGLPVPFSKIGQYYNGRKQEVVFREGEVIVREGTSNVALKYSHWAGLLRRHVERREEAARRPSEELLRVFVERSTDHSSQGDDTDAADSIEDDSDEPVGGISVVPPKNPGSSAAGKSSSVTPRRGGGGGRISPLLIGMEWQAFGDALLTHLEAPTTIRIQQFLEEAQQTVADNLPVDEPQADNNGTYSAALDSIAVVAANAARFNRTDIAQMAISTLRDSYEAEGRTRTRDAGDVGSDLDSAKHWLEVLQRVLAVGRILVATERLGLLPELVHRPVPVFEGYVYATWIRHAQVAAFRRELLSSGQGHESASMLSYARLALQEKPWLRPDVRTRVDFNVGGQLDKNDRLLNSLAEFDLWWCVMVERDGHGTTSHAWYPSCSGLHQYRSQPAMNTMATDSAARGLTFEGNDDAASALALMRVIKAAEAESHRYGGWWDGIEQGPVRTFIEDNGIQV
jgi:hypothetical protein